MALLLLLLFVMLPKLLGVSENFWTFEKICWDAYMDQKKILGVILNSSLSLTLHVWWARKSFGFYFQNISRLWPHLAPPLTLRWSSHQQHLTPRFGLCCCHDTLSLFSAPYYTNHVLLETQQLFLVLTQKKIQSPIHDPEVSTWSVPASSPSALLFSHFPRPTGLTRTLVLSVLLGRDTILFCQRSFRVTFFLPLEFWSNGTCDVLPSLPISFSSFLSLAFIPNITVMFSFSYSLSVSLEYEFYKGNLM